MKIKSVLVIMLLLFAFSSFSQVKKYIGKAENAVYIGDCPKAKEYYLKALAIEKDNYQANLGLGLTMAYFMEDFEDCLPYLENALRLSPVNNVSIDLYYALGKTYHYLGRYTEALTYYEKMIEYDEPDNIMFQPELNKRMDDCKYAMANPQFSNANKWYVVNAGKTINTAMPEYVPVLIGDNKMIFTSKRKDDEKEKINKDNGQYFESMYITDINNGYTSNPSRYSIPSLNPKSKFKNSNESIISMIPGTKKIFIYKDQKLYEGDLTATTKSPDQISKVINFDEYQNHAFVGEAGKEIYFTSDAEKGLGGNDIYRSVKLSDGSWGAPENLGEAVNTKFEEEAPFMSEDGKTLFFASTGHPGYGGFDIYKTVYENGKWSTPVNMGQPFNSPANDLFYVGSSDGTVGYMSSSRKGGNGDMDIYKINYTDKLPKNCNSNLSSSLVINYKEISTGSSRYELSSTIPNDLRDKIISYELMVNDSVVSDSYSALEYDFKSNGNYLLKAKVVAWCDTCINLFVACNETRLEIKKAEAILPVLASLDDLNIIHGELNSDVLKQLGFDFTSLYFDNNSYTLRADAVASLEKNIELLKKYPDFKIVLNGYTDAKGAEDHNRRLSRNRADAVKQFLKQYSLKNKVDVNGKGETDLVNNCGNDSDCDDTLHQKNRRVEIKIVKK